MKDKEGRDYIILEDCIVSVREYLSGEKFIQISNTCETIKISKAEFAKFVKFVNSKLT
jgi:hypothetical protein